MREITGSKCVRAQQYKMGVIETVLPDVIYIHLDLLEEDASSPLVLERQQLLSMLPLLVTVLFEEMVEAWKGHIVAGEVKGLLTDRRAKTLSVRSPLFSGNQKYITVVKRPQHES